MILSKNKKKYWINWNKATDPKSHDSFEKRKKIGVVYYYMLNFLNNLQVKIQLLTKDCKYNSVVRFNPKLWKLFSLIDTNFDLNNAALEEN